MLHRLYALVAIMLVASPYVMAQTTVTVFDNGQTRYRIPSIVTLTGDSLMAFCDLRYSTGDLGSGVADIVAKTSTDKGATWGSLTTPLKGNKAYSDYRYAYGDAATVVDRETGEVLILCGGGRQGVTGASQSNPIGFVRALSKDKGQTWEVSELTSTIYALCSAFTGMFFTSGRICQSSRIKVGTHYRIYSAIASFNLGAVVAYSDDFGVTWALLGGSDARPGMVNGNVCSSESKLEELPDGNVLLSCRGGSGYQNGRWYNVFSYNDQSWTTGSWDTLVNLSYGSGQCSTSDGEVLLVPVKDADGNELHALLQSADYPARQGIRIGCKLLRDVSDYDEPSDFLSGWSYYQVTSLSSCYSTMSLDQEGNVAFLYEENSSNSGYDIQFKSIPLATLVGNGYTYNSGDNSTITTVAKPVFSVAGGTFSEELTVSLSCATEGAVIHYTTDGTEPTASSEVYDNPLTISQTTTVKAVAVKDGQLSSVATATYTLAEETLEENVLPVDGGVYTIHAQHASSSSPFYVYNNDGTLSINITSAPAQVTATAAYLWVCQKASDGTFYFSSLDGQGYLGLDSNEKAAFVHDFSSALKITAFVKGPVSSGNYTSSTMSGYALQHTQNSSNAYVCVNSSGSFDRYRITTNTTTYTYTTDFIFNKVPYSVSGDDLGTLAAPVHHGFKVSFARHDDSCDGVADYHCYATLNLPFAVSLPDEVTAHRLNSLTPVKGSRVETESCFRGSTGDILPGETPVLLQTDGEKGDGQSTRVLSFKPAPAQDAVETGFNGTLIRQILSGYDETNGLDGYRYYILAKKNGRVAFYYLTSNKSGEMALGNNKAYYRHPTTSAAKPDMFTIGTGGEPTTVSQPSAGPSGDSAVYDLTGRRVVRHVRGIYLQGGKKMVIK